MRRKRATTRSRSATTTTTRPSAQTSVRLQRSLRLAFACQHSDPALLETDHDQEQTPSHGSAHPDGNCTDACDCGPGLPCGEYLWDHRNGSMLQDFLVNEYILGPDGVGNENVTGVFIDDYWCYVSSRHCWHLGRILPRVPAISLRAGWFSAVC